MKMLIRIQNNKSSKTFLKNYPKELKLLYKKRITKRNKEMINQINRLAYAKEVIKSHLEEKICIVNFLESMIRITNKL